MFPTSNCVKEKTKQQKMNKITSKASPAKLTSPPSSNTKKKKKGRPSLTDLKQKKSQQINHRRSTRRNPNDDDDEEDDVYSDEDDERKKKKVKLVVKLPQLSSNSGSNDSHPRSDDVIPKIKEEKVPKVTESLQESPLDAGPTNTPLPDKKLLVFILDRLQKKDTYAVFSEPVDPDELPDYHEIIEQPMDFGTVRSKLDKGKYTNLEELEADVILICSNAMQYNPSDTVFFRQARSIQELAKRDFENLRQEGEDGELQPKVIKRGRPPGKNSKKPPGKPSLDAVPPETTSDPTPAPAPVPTSVPTVANVVDNTNESTPYNLRRGPMMYKNYADSLLPSHRSRNGEHSELLADWNEEFPARIKRADLKYGNKNFIIDETRRDTYKQFHPSSAQNSLLTNFGGERKQLLAVGLNAEHGYSRSLARFAAHMGPVVWKVASKKIEKALPPGVTFAPGVVGEPEPSPPPTSFFSSGNQNYTPKVAIDNILNRPETPSTSGPNSAITEAEMRAPKIEDSGIKSKPLPHHGKNGLNGILGSNLSKMGMFGDNPGKPAWQQVSSSNHRQFTVPVPPDLNVGLQGTSGSPGSVGLGISSPQHPDLVLQL